MPQATGFVFSKFTVAGKSSLVFLGISGQDF